MPAYDGGSAHGLHELERLGGRRRHLEDVAVGHQAKEADPGEVGHENPGAGFEYAVEPGACDRMMGVVCPKRCQQHVDVENDHARSPLASRAS